ncbi:MAG TPA: dsRBD fold-containing protein [Acidimicrobiia bacterium]|nr:dsRBD fold-containing protein [Acidimicrobiia bacterium]
MALRSPESEQREDTIEKDVTLHLHLAEDETETMAHAVLNLRGDHFESVGKARRNPIDPPLPVIGEELAIARALQDLTGQVMRAAQDKIADFLINQ